MRLLLRKWENTSATNAYFLKLMTGISYPDLHVPAVKQQLCDSALNAN